MARAIVLRQLTASPKSRLQLERKLAERNVPEDVAAAVLDRFEEVRLVDDAEFADMWVRRVTAAVVAIMGVVDVVAAAASRPPLRTGLLGVDYAVAAIVGARYVLLAAGVAALMVARGLLHAKFFLHRGYPKNLVRVRKVRQPLHGFNHHGAAHAIIPAFA